MTRVVLKGAKFHFNGQQHRGLTPLKKYHRSKLTQFELSLLREGELCPSHLYHPPRVVARLLLQLLKRQRPFAHQEMPLHDSLALMQRKLTVTMSKNEGDIRIIERGGSFPNPLFRLNLPTGSSILSNLHLRIPFSHIFSPIRRPVVIETDDSGSIAFSIPVSLCVCVG